MDAGDIVSEALADDDSERLDFLREPDDSEPLSQWTSTLEAQEVLTFDWLLTSIRDLESEDRYEAKQRYDRLDANRKYDATWQELYGDWTQEQFDALDAEVEAEKAIQENLLHSEKFYDDGPHHKSPEAHAAYADEFLKTAKTIFGQWTDLSEDYDFSIHEVVERAREERSEAHRAANLGKHYFRYAPDHAALTARFRARHQCASVFLQVCKWIDWDFDRATGCFFLWLQDLEKWAGGDVNERTPPPDPECLYESAPQAESDDRKPLEPKPPTSPSPPFWKPARQLLTEFRDLRDPVIVGLLRAGEVLNVISVPKAGKTWLIHDLCISLAAGRKWLDKFETVRGRVLLIDNELHSESLASRLPIIASAKGVEPEEYVDRLSVANLRGGLIDLKKLAGQLQWIRPGDFNLIVLDAFYRFLPDGSDENSNSDVTQLYNLLDGIAMRSGVAIVCVHHSSKGSQSGKAVTDTGSGAGAQSRAADSHLVLRQHETGGAFVVDAVTRSWPPVAPFCLRWSLPTFELASDLDPTALKSDRPARPKPEKPAKWTAARFVEQLLTDRPRNKPALIDDAAELGISSRQAKELLSSAVVQGKAFDWGKEMFANCPYPISEEAKATDPRRAKVRALLAAEPELSNPTIATRCGCSKELVRIVRHEIDNE